MPQQSSPTGDSGEQILPELSAPGKRSTVPAPKENYYLGMRRSPLTTWQSVQKVPSLPSFLSLYEVFRGKSLMF